MSNANSKWGHVVPREQANDQNPVTRRLKVPGGWAPLVFVPDPIAELEPRHD